MTRPELAGADDHLRLGVVAGLDDHRVDEVPVEDVVLDGLVVPAELAGGGVEGHDRVGVEVRARAARAVGGLGGAGERGGVGDAPVDGAGVLVDGRRVPGPAAGVDRRVAPEVVALDGVERPADLAGLGVEGVEDAPVAARVLARRG